MSLRSRRVRLSGSRHVGHHLRHQELRHDEEGAGLARQAWHRLWLPRLEDCGHRSGAARALGKEGRLGDIAQSGRDDLQETTRQGEGRHHAGKGAHPDAQAAVDDQTARPGGGRGKIAGRLQARAIRGNIGLTNAIQAAHLLAVLRGRPLILPAFPATCRFMNKPMVTSDSIPATPLAAEVDRRRTFAIISHPDAGQTTLTEKLWLFGVAINLAGQVKAKRDRRSTRSDWMAIERERGISVVTSVMT